MKNVILAILLCLFFKMTAQVQIGQNINGEAPGDGSGLGLSLSSDGSILAIGGPNNDGAAPDNGYVRVFENVNGAWTQIGQDIDGAVQDDSSGSFLNLNAAGNIVAIGASQNDDNGENSGHVRVFENVEGNWVQIGQDIDGEAQGDLSGGALSLNNAGNILAVGADQNDGNGTRSGHVRVFENVEGNWVQIGQDIDGEAQGDQSGFEVVLNSSGNILAIGFIDNDDNGESSGHVRILQNVNGAWVQIGEDIAGEQEGDRSGVGLALSNSGSILAIGGILNDGNGTNSGHVRIFDLDTILSLEEITQLQFELFPNPAADVLNIQLPQGMVLETVNIYNNIGQLVDTIDQGIVNTSNLSSGLYFVEVITAAGRASQKLVIE